MLSSIKIAFLLVISLAVVYVHCEDDMNLHVSIVDTKNELNVDEDINSEEKQAAEDLCLYVKCGAGEMCVINDGEAYCECIELCEVPNDHRQQVKLHQIN